jgi:membrane fusion protein (multidrug efflux system)
MKNFFKLSAAFVLITASLLAACEGQERAEQKTQAVSVQAEVIGLTNLEQVRTYTGSLEGEKQTVIYARIAESVEKIHVTEGDSVAAGRVLISLDKEGSTSGYNESLSLFLNAEKNYRKMEFLYAEGAVSESQYDAAKTDYEVSKAAFEAVSGMVDIQSPIAGVVTAIDVSEGEFVTIGQKLATVASTRRLRVRFGVSAESIGSFSAGSEIWVYCDMVDEVARGEVFSVAGSADPVTRAFEVEALIDNSDGSLRPGLFVRIEFLQKRLDSVIAVPNRAVLMLDEQPTVFVLKDGHSKKRPVALGADFSGAVVVTSGLSVGDTLITLGQQFLDDDMPVNLAALKGQSE